jgi:hypothetical protein
MKKIAAVALAAFAITAHAQVDVEFQSDVRWYSNDHHLLYGGPCSAAAVRGYPDDPSKPQYTFWLSCPGYDRLRVVVWHNDLATVGDYPAHILSRTLHSTKVVTGQSETLEFSYPGALP